MKNPIPSQEPSTKNHGAKSDGAAGTKFPQFTRLFSAPISTKLLSAAKTVLLLVILTTIIILNTDIASHPLFSSLIGRLQTFPPLPRLSGITNILGLSTGSIDNTGISDTQTILETKYHAWQEIVKNKPDYRDGYYTLAVLAYQLGKIDESKQYVESVRTLDPNYPGIEALEKLLLEQK